MKLHRDLYPEVGMVPVPQIARDLWVRDSAPFNLCRWGRRQQTRFQEIEKGTRGNWESRSYIKDMPKRRSEPYSGDPCSCFVLGQIEPGAKVYTDEHAGYDRLPNHESVKHSARQVS